MSWYLPDNIAIDFAVFEHRSTNKNPIPLHNHGYYEIEFVVSGMMLNTINGFRKKMQRGDLSMLSIGDSHKLDFQLENVLIYKLNFRSDAFPTDMCQIIEKTPLPLVQHYEGDEFNAVLSEFEKVAQIVKTPMQSPLTAISLRVAAETLLCRILGWVPVSEFFPQLPITVMEGMKYIRTHFSEPFRLSDLAAAACLSSDHFSHIFRKYTSLSPKAYLRECRMQAAHELLMNTDLPIAEIAWKIGYNSSSLFYRQFEDYFGKKPLDIRRESRYTD